MWRVQTEGYSDGEGMLVGVVSPGRLLTLSPDGEYISSGINTKGSDSVALGRQGPFFHWGFAASPTYMTEEAKLVFVNAVHYISKFKGQRAVTKKKIFATRASLDDMYFTLSDEGFDRWQEMLAALRAENEERRQKLKDRQDSGEQLLEFEEMLLKSPPLREYTRQDLVSLPEDLIERFGDNWPKYEEYYSENYDYLYCPDAESDRGLLLDVDLEAKKLGIPNYSTAIIERCIELLDGEKKDDAELAARILRRYTMENFESSADWRDWFDRHRKSLYFSDVSGFKFLVNLNQETDSAADKIETESSSIESMLKEVDAPAVNDSNPVNFSAVLRRVTDENGRQRYRLIVKSAVQKGWHHYAFVPETAAYVQTDYQTSKLKGLKPIGKWRKAAGTPSLHDPKVLTWDKNTVAWREFASTDTDKPSLELSIRFQACDALRCFPPKTISLEVSP